MSATPCPEQRLVASRARLAAALREPVWLILWQRLTQTPGVPKGAAPGDPATAHAAPPSSAAAPASQGGSSGPKRRAN